MVNRAEPGGALPHRKGWKDPRARLVLGALALVGLGWALWRPAPPPTEVSPQGAASSTRPAPGVGGDGATSGAESEVVLVAPRLERGAPPPSEGSTIPERVDEGAEVGIRSPPGLYGGAKVEPLYDLRSDALRGVRLSRIREGSFWERLGVREGDVVLEVNGQLIDSPAASVMLMNSLSREPVLILRVRGEQGPERFLEYRSPGDT